MIEDLLDQWEQLVEVNPRLPLEQFISTHCDSIAGDVVATFRAKAERLDQIDRKLCRLLEGSQSITPSETSNGFLSLVTGFEPVAGYTLVQKLGSGGFGEVWKASGPGGFHVALKFVPMNKQVGQTELRSLDVIREIRHPNLLTYFGTWVVGDLLVIATELADRTLLDRLHEVQGKGRDGIPVLELLCYMDEAAKGIDYLNEPTTHGRLRIQHRDIKPQNLLLSGGSVKVGDFGLARAVRFEATGHTGCLTLAYAAPECLDGTTSFRSDQYSLAVSYCYLRGGRLPFEGSHVEIIDGHRMKSPDLLMLPECERFAVAKALEKLPKNRWPSSTKFVQALREAIEKTDSPLHTASQSTDATRRVVLVGSVCSALLLLSIFIWIVLRLTTGFYTSNDIGVDVNQNGIEPSNSTSTSDTDSTNDGEGMHAPTLNSSGMSLGTKKSSKEIEKEVVTSEDAKEFLLNPK